MAIIYLPEFDLLNIFRLLRFWTEQIVLHCGSSVEHSFLIKSDVLGK